LDAIINGRIPPSHGLREEVRQHYADESKFDWFDASVIEKASFAKSVMALEGHARYYIPARQVCESFLKSQARSGKQRSIYRYVFNWATSHWPYDWPVTHTADILPMFLHSSLSPAERFIACTLTDRLIAFTTQRQEKVSWSEYTLEDRALNELNATGQWYLLMEDKGAFNLRKESVALWEKVISSVLDTGRDGWAHMIR
jgi:hypothetical protein